MISTADVATVAGIEARRLRDLAALEADMAVVGPAATCRCAPADNLALHRLVASSPPGAVLVAAVAEDKGDHAYFGELMALDARGRALAGLVVDGPVRDMQALAAIGLPVFHRGSAAAPCVKVEVASVGEPVEIDGTVVAPGDVVVADRDAVLVVAREIWPEVEAGVRALEERERDIRDALARGERLTDLLGLDQGGAA
jgi:4-hydroxy-4-methyl-2-oxoglutarate aldolase